MQEDNILTADAETYLDYLREKYGVSSKKSAKTRRKGIEQLTRLTEIMSNDKFLMQNEEFSRAQVIYPILLVHDPLLAAPVHGDFLASEFKTYLRPNAELRSGLFKKGRFTIHSLIIMTIEDLENLETSLEHFGLRDLLSDYSRDCADRRVSLNNYIATSSYAGKMFYNRSLPVKALELIDKTRILFEKEKTNNTDKP